MEFDAFDEGIELGGLRNRDEIRLLICYILRAVDAPISKQNLNDSMLQDGLANYFEINQAISELLKNGIQPFRKGTEEAEHLGMGLYICDLLCRKHGGTLKIANTDIGAVASAILKIS